MRRRQRWVLALAALFGIAGGVTTGVLAPGASDPGTVDAEVNDPLRLGIPQVSLPSCSDESVLVLGSGDGEAALTPIVSDAGSGARYLRTDESCETLWADGGELPSYVVYRGPYDSMVEPCRTSLADDGDVTNLSAGNQEFVMCACVLPTAELVGIVPPGQLAEGQEPAPVPWVRMLQRLLGVDVTGAYESDAVTRVRQFQETNGILPADGKVGERTWGALREQRCGSFDF